MPRLEAPTSCATKFVYTKVKAAFVHLGRWQQLQLQAGAVSHSRYLPLRQQHGSWRPRLQLPRRQVRKDLRGTPSVSRRYWASTASSNSSNSMGIAVLGTYGSRSRRPPPSRRSPGSPRVEGQPVRREIRAEAS
ncbi:hypothetical protein LV779_05040 [Streptomyces thinghirensis]|nr:hypothetical protein [Streptomyces thinghirensis]